MTNNTWLLLDVFNLGYKALFTPVHSLQWKGETVGSMFGIFNQVMHLVNRFDTPNICWCFDYGKPLRAKELPEYKGKRKDNIKPEDLAKREVMKEQVHRMRTEILPEMGFGNVFFEKGYEADDIIASLCLNSIPDTRKKIIVSGDEDMFQLLNKSTSIYNSKTRTILDVETFIEQWHIHPTQWADVKAIAGCSSDNVSGVKGVGEKTAIKFLGGALKPESTAYRAIVKSKRWGRNLPLVSLPYKGCPVFKRKRDTITPRTWDKMMKRFGFETLYRAWSFYNG